MKLKGSASASYSGLTWKKPGPRNGEAVGLQASIIHQLHVSLKMCPALCE